MDNFDPYNVLLAIATNMPVLLMTAFVLQSHIYVIYWGFQWSLFIIVPFSSTAWPKTLMTKKLQDNKPNQESPPITVLPSQKENVLNDNK